MGMAGVDILIRSLAWLEKIGRLQHTAPHFNILRIQHQFSHSRIEVGECFHQLLWCGTNVPSIFPEIVNRCGIEAVAAHNFTVATG